ncbi:MAG: glycosidase [Verrucomicrobia bacterium]|nr:MAG: glycosidase [Verrucomicrobiota bacterium]
MKRICCAAFLASCLVSSSTAQSAAHPAKTYRNPLLDGREMADPHVIRVDGKYYLYATTDSRGYEVFVSDDLVHWDRKARAFKDPRAGDWAPEVLRYKKDGKYYLYYTDNETTGVHGLSHKQVGVAIADSPLGPFADKSILAFDAIDADPFQDEDGALYLYYVDLEHGFKIVVQPMSDPLTKKGDHRVLIHPTEEWEQRSGRVTEGPFMLKHKGTYYLMYSGTGADSPDYAIGYATSKSPLGPFDKYAGNPVAHRGGKVLGPGHHCVITGPDGKLWLVYHQKWDTTKSFHRFLALDPLWFDDAGVIHTRLSRDEDEPAP